MRAYPDWLLPSLESFGKAGALGIAVPTSETVVGLCPRQALGMTVPPPRSAGFQPAVSPTSSRQTSRLENTPEGSNARTIASMPQAGSPAIQQTGSLHYEPELCVSRPYFVMELVRGIRITDYCDQAILS